MPDEIFERVLLPVAGVDDAHVTTRAVVRYLPSDAHVVALHVLVDKEYDEGFESRKTLMTVEAVLEDSGISVDTHEVKADDAVSSIHRVARELDATSIAFTPRDHGGIQGFFSGDLTCDLVEESEIPVLVMPAVEENGAGDR